MTNRTGKLSNIIRWGACLLLFVFTAAWGQSEQVLLPSEEAFAFSSEIVDNEVVVTWTVAEGYYMYEDKFKLFSSTLDIELGDMVLPPGKMKDDPLFGEVIVYEKEVKVRAPILSKMSVSAPQFEAWGQGCNEPIGVCYPPIKHKFSVPYEYVPVALDSNDNQVGAVGDSLSDLAKLGMEIMGNEVSFLDAKDAFKINAVPVGGQKVLTSFEVADGYYIYRDKIEFDGWGLATVKRIIWPEANSYTDEYFGEQLIYPTDFDVGLQLVRSTPDSGEFLLTVKYQGCKRDSICYPPVTESIPLFLDSLVPAAMAAGDDPPSDSSEESGSGNWWLIITALGTGLMLTFTPCVLPLIPVLSSIVAGQGEVGRMRAGMLSLIYVAGTVVTYAAIGAVAGATGDQLQAYFQNIWAIGTLSVILILMSLSMFGLYELRLPSSVETRMHESTSKLGGGKIGTVFFLGAGSALIVSACVSPLLISVLGVAIAKADPYLGAAIMAALASGMGIVLVIIGFGIGVSLPKAGVWMDRVKQVFGVMLLGVAIYLLGTIPAVPVIFLWAALLIVIAVYLGATQSLPSDASGWKYLLKGTGTVMLIWGALAMVGGIYGNRDILRPLPQLSMLASGIGGIATMPESEKVFEKVTTVKSFEEHLASAVSSQRPVIVDFYADWCVDCIRLERTTFKDPLVVRVLQDDFVTLQIDVTDPKDEVGRSIRKRFDIFGPPAMVFIDETGEQITDLTQYGYVDRDEMLTILSKV